MNDYSFGNKLYSLRSKSKLSQSELGSMVGVSNKAVSKWEMGKAKPSLEIINKLSLIFNVKIEELINEDKKNNDIHMIVITGGPCAGKSTALNWIDNAFSSKGYTVLFVGEIATELINTGISFGRFSRVDFQRAIMKMQREKEKIYYESATKLNGKVLIVCDRGALDSKAYMSELDFQYLLKELGANEVELRDSYDGVFHLVSAAKGAENYYTFETNRARKETIEEAAKLDDKIISAWTGHPHLKIIDNSTGFEEKLQRLIAEISSFLGEPDPLEIERKYLIEYPNIKQLESMENCEKIEIIQTYLLNDTDDKVRIRQRGKDGNYIYYKTVKRKIDDFRQVEVEKRLTKEEYLTLLMKADPNFRQMRKTRYCMIYNKQSYKIDVFPFWSDKALLKVELKAVDSRVEFPSFINVLEEVTGDSNYKNSSLSKIN